MNRLLTVLIASLITACSADKEPVHPFAEYSNNLAKNMTIDALSVQSENELRVWSVNGLVGDLRVIIITPDSIKDCSALSSFSLTYNETISRKHCTEHSLGLSDETLKTVFADIQAIDEQDLSCLGPMDGPAGLIEILYSGRWVAVQYESPHECNLQPVLNIFNTINTFRQSLDQSG